MVDKAKIAEFSSRVTDLLKIMLPRKSLNDLVLAVYYDKTLHALDKVLQTCPENELVNRLEAFLANNWKLINGSCLSYTQLPDHDLTRLLCQIAEYIKENSDKKDLSVLKLLMPTVSLEAVNFSYPHLDTLDVRQVLKTYILGNKGQYLIPVTQFTQLLDTNPIHWDNPYFDTFNDLHKGMDKYSQEEYTRLAKHSPEIAAVTKAKAEYEAAIEQQGSLLSHLRRLSSRFYLNSISGIGDEIVADAGVYIPLYEFRDYYNGLGDENKNKIPAAVKNKIDTILGNAFDIDKNKRADIYGLCTYVLRIGLDSVIAPEESALSRIGVDNASNAILIDAKRKHLEQCKETLNKALLQKTYKGNDQLGLTRNLLKELGIEHTINATADLGEYNIAELTDLFMDEKFQENFLARIKNLKDLIQFINETPFEKLEMIWTRCQEKLTAKLKVFLMSGTAFSANLFIDMQKDKVALITRLSQSYFKGILTKPTGIYEFLQPLPTANCTAVCEVMEQHLKETIKHIDDLYMLIAPKAYKSYAVNNITPALSQEQAIVVCKALSAFKTPEQIRRLIDYPDYYPKRALVCKALIASFTPEEIIKVCVPLPTDNLGEVLQPLSPQQITAVFKALDLATLINKGVYLDRIISMLTTEQAVAVCNGMTNRLYQLVPTANINKFMQDYFPNEHERKAVQNHFFTGLLEEVKRKSRKLVDEGSMPAYLAADKLYKDLKKASKAYFDESSISYERFESDCKKAIHDAEELKNHRGWGGFLGNLLVTVISFGVIPLVLSVANRVSTGQWDFRLFKTDSQRLTDSIVGVVDVVKKPK